MRAEHPDWGYETFIEGFRKDVVNTMKSLTAQRIGCAMRSLGFKPHYSHGRSGYRVVVYSPEEIAANRRLLAYDARPESETIVSDREEGGGGVP